MEASEIMYFNFDGYVPDSEHPIQVSSVAQYTSEPHTVDMLIKKGSKPTMADFDLAYTGGICSHWHDDLGWYPSKPEGAEDLYYCLTGGKTEFVEIDKPMEQDTFYIMLYNVGDERVRGQRLIATTY